MGVHVIRTQTGTPGAGGGSFTLAAPTIGTLYNVQASNPTTQIAARYGDWVFALIAVKSAADYPSWGGWTHTTGWTNAGFGPAPGGILGSQLLYAQLGPFLDSPQSAGSGPGGVVASMFLVVDNRPTITVGGNQEHQYSVEGMSLVGSSGGVGAGTLTLPTFAPATPQPWEYRLLTTDGNYGTDITGFDAPWTFITDTIFPAWARYDIPNPAGPSLAPAVLSVTNGVTAVALALSDNYGGATYTADRIFGARRARPEPPRVAQEQGGGITIS